MEARPRQPIERRDEERGVGLEIRHELARGGRREALERRPASEEPLAGGDSRTDPAGRETCGSRRREEAQPLGHGRHRPRVRHAGWIGGGEIGDRPWRGMEPGDGIETALKDGFVGPR